MIDGVLLRETADHHFVITPDNGTLTHLAKFVGLKRVSVIDEAAHALPGSQRRVTRFMVGIFMRIMAQSWRVARLRLRI